MPCIRIREILLMVGSFAVVGCHGPDLAYVPWYRGIPANFLAKNSLEAEVWRQQRTGVVEGWPLPPITVVRDPIPLAGTDAPREVEEVSPFADEELPEDHTDSSRRTGQFVSRSRQAR